MLKTPSSERIKISIVGTCNAGKSSLINNITERNIAIVSEKEGTTTDPVQYPMELGDLGPVVLIDTAGLDDTTELGKLRIKKSEEKIFISDIIIFVTNVNLKLKDIELLYFKKILEKKIPVIIAFTFYNGFIEEYKNMLINLLFENCDFNRKNNKLNNREIFFEFVDNNTKMGIHRLKEKIISIGSFIDKEPTILDGIISDKTLVLLVTPIDTAAPKGRLILPQVEAIRDILDKNSASIVVKESELKYFYDRMEPKPDLVITDSQAFGYVKTVLPENQKLTSFSILMARKKGELLPFIENISRFYSYKYYSKKEEKGKLFINDQYISNKIYVYEFCTHHRKEDDIATYKIPKLFKQKINQYFEFETIRVIPEDISPENCSGIIMCGGCMITRKDYSLKMQYLIDKGIPILNYGLFLAWVNDLLPRAIEIFPDIYEKFIKIYENNLIK
jgi:[FeFe] hydrogenase H-cluster maturation GTPase HydF